MSKNAGQGIEGTILWQEGNFMPSTERSKASGSRMESAVIRELRIHELANLDNVVKAGETIYSSVNTKLIKKQMSEPNGHFKISLPPGEYSVFTVEEEGLFANLYDSDGNICPISVKEGAYSHLVIKINYKAFF